MRTPRGLVRIALTVALAVSLGGCWLQPGFDAGRGNWNPLELQLNSRTVGAGLTQRWSATLLPVATGVNSPLSSGGRIFTTTGFGSSASAVDARTGAILWTRDLFDPAANLFQYLTAPVLDHGELIVGKTIDATHGALYRLDADTGAVLSTTPSDPVARVAMAGGVPAVLTRTPTAVSLSWKFDIVVPTTPEDGAPNTFAIVGDHVLWSHGNLATGYSSACPADPAGGCSPDWSTDLGAQVTDAEAIGHGQAVYSYGPAGLAVLDVATGAVRWTASVGQFFGTARVVAVAGGKIVVAVEDALLASRLLAFPAGGCGAATCSPVWSADFDGTIGSLTPPFVAGGDVVWVAGRLPGGSDIPAISAFALRGCGAPTCGALTSIPYGMNGGNAIVDGGQLIVGDIIGRVTAYGLLAPSK